MMHNRGTSAGPGLGLLDRLGGDRKKTVLAAGLLAVMGIMWMRVLTGKKTPSANAASNPTETTETTEAPATKLEFIELPVIEGRNDCIGRDVFSAEALSSFRRESPSQGTGTDTEVRTETSQKIQEVANRVLTLVAIFEGPRAYINDQVVGIGETLSVTEGDATYAFEVVRIENDSVLVKCRDKEVMLKLTR